MKQLSIVVIVLAVSATAQAINPLNLTFDTGTEGFVPAAPSGVVNWVPGGVPGWAGGAVIQQGMDVGGWTMGSGGGPMRGYGWDDGQQLIQHIVATGGGWLHFDVLMDGSSFPGNANGAWWQLNMAGNSEHGWTQLQDILAGTPNSGWRNGGDTNLYTWHVDVDFSWIGWTPGATWYQIYFGTNSDAAQPVKFYLDNVTITPEPVTLAVLGLGSLLLLRRRSH